ncbi:MAG: aldo/keto reductase [Acidobacteriota bacterium]|nr:aldo/keto reductase [Acidobacteriota bacterium]
MLIAGYATSEGTERFRKRFENRLPGHFREARGLWLSSIGIGTYLGEPDAQCDKSYAAAVSLALDLGVNVIDSAVNYRHQRSERAIGRALHEQIRGGALCRDEVFLATKGGFLSFDGDAPRDPHAYFYEQVIQSGLAKPEEVAAECHVISPAYLKQQIEVSCRNLGVETIDLYYVHNPETQLAAVGRGEFRARLMDAFSALEWAVMQGKIRFYGVATWNAFRTGGESRDAFQLGEALSAAEEAGGKKHHFCAVQLPFNFAMTEALTKPTQKLAGRSVPLLRAASELGLMVFASASLLQGQLTEGLPPEIASHFPSFKTDAQRSLQFVRSTPGITCALVGMSNPRHVEENLATASMPPLTLDAYQAIYSGS